MIYTEYDEAVRAQIQRMEDPATSLSDFMAAAVEFRRLVEAYAAQPGVLEPLNATGFIPLNNQPTPMANDSFGEYSGVSSSAPEKPANIPPAPSP